MNKLLKRFRTRETTGGLKWTAKIPKLSDTIKIWSLKITGSEKRSFKVERITLSGTAVRNKRIVCWNNVLLKRLYSKTYAYYDKCVPRKLFVCYSCSKFVSKIVEQNLTSSNYTSIW